MQATTYRNRLIQLWFSIFAFNIFGHISYTEVMFSIKGKPLVTVNLGEVFDGAMSSNVRI